MTALATERDTLEMGAHALVEQISVPLAATTKVYQGGIVCVNAAGYGTPGAATYGLKAVGRAEETVDNTGSAGDLSVNVKRGCFKFANSATTDALTIADVGRDCYIVDDQTVARTNATGLRPVAGMVVQVDSDGVWVEFGPARFANGQPIELFLVAAADLSAKQYYFVKVDSAAKAALGGAGDFCAGVLQNAPAADAIAVVRVTGITNVIASGTIAIGAVLASDSAGKSKAAVLGKTDTSDGGAAADPLLGSNVMGVALTAGATDTAHRMLLTHSGACPTTAS